MNSSLKRLTEVACELGGSAAAVIPIESIVIDPSLADKCREPRCPNYGLSKNCPPHISGPSAFQEMLRSFHRAMLFKIDVPFEMLYSSENREIFQLLHEIAAELERTAVQAGFVQAKAYVGGSCKRIFCYDEHECLALTESHTCRHSESARPSMSGFGINVGKLFQAAGWTMTWREENDDITETKMGSVSGLILLD